MIAREYMRTGAGSEGGHWYNPGPPPECVYEIVGANGAWRKPTIRDARKHGWFPGSTTIIGQEAKPGLEKWKVRQGIWAALTHPKAHEVTDAEELIRMLEQDGEAQAKAARERGTAIHAAIEQYYMTGALDEAYEPYVTGVRRKLAELTGVDDRRLWTPEETLVHPFGFGSRIDLKSAALNMIVDFKGKDVDAGKGETPETWAPEGYPEQHRQLASYQRLADMPNARIVNLYIARNVPGLVHAHEWQPDGGQAWREFVCLLAYWQIKNKFPLRVKLSPEMRQALEIA